MRHAQALYQETQSDILPVLGGEHFVWRLQPHGIAALRMLIRKRCRYDNFVATPFHLFYLISCDIVWGLVQQSSQLGIEFTWVNLYLGISFYCSTFIWISQNKLAYLKSWKKIEICWKSTSVVWIIEATCIAIQNFNNA